MAAKASIEICAGGFNREFSPVGYRGLGITKVPQKLNKNCKRRVKF